MFDSNFFAIMQRKGEILAEIRALKREIGEAQNQIDAVTACKALISTAVENWNSQHSTFQSITLAPVKVETQFEGYSADKITEKLLPVVEELNKSSILAKSVFPGIADQIEKLNKFIEEIQLRIDALQAEYDSLG